MARTTYYPEPGITKFLFASKAMAPLWTVVRIYLGWLWLSAGWNKVFSPAWTGENAGAAVRGYLNNALRLAGEDPPVVAPWYAWMIENIFLPNAVLMSYLVAWGEVLVGIALIVGFLTGLSAFFGGLMNASFLLAGTLSTNPIMFILATWLVLAWRVAGYYGLDYWVLPRIGAPKLGFDRDTPEPGTTGPGTTGTGTTGTGTVGPRATEPAATEPAATVPAAARPGVTRADATGGARVVDEPVVDEPVVDEPVVDRRTTPGPKGQRSTRDRPTAPESTADDVPPTSTTRDDETG
jgi:thiosulfate dehydrogenase (quinone) large subunit